MVRSRKTCCSGNGTRQSVFPQYLIRGTNFSEKTAEHKMWVSIFSTHYVWNIPHSKMNSAKYLKCTRLHVKYPLFLLVLEIRLQFSQQFSEKHSNSNLMENRPLGTRLFHAYGQTDNDRATDDVRNVANAPKKPDAELCQNTGVWEVSSLSDNANTQSKPPYSNWSPQCKYTSSQGLQADTTQKWCTSQFVPFFFFHYFGAIAILRKATIWFVVSVRSSASNNSAPTGEIFVTYNIWAFCENLLRKFKFHLTF